MPRHVFLTEFEAASSLDSVDPGVFLNFTFASSFNKMMETEQKVYGILKFISMIPMVSIRTYHFQDNKTNVFQNIKLMIPGTNRS